MSVQSSLCLFTDPPLLNIFFGKSPNLCTQVPVQKTRTVQPPPRSEVKCEDVTDYVEQCRTEYTDKTVEVPVKRSDYY